MNLVKEKVYLEGAILIDNSVATLKEPITIDLTPLIFLFPIVMIYSSLLMSYYKSNN